MNWALLFKDLAHLNWGADFWALCVVVFVAVAIADVCWAQYTKAASGGQTRAAAKWSVLIFFFGMFSIENYTHDYRFVLPALLGAYVGTFLGVRYSA